MNLPKPTDMFCILLFDGPDTRQYKLLQVSVQIVRNVFSRKPSEPVDAQNLVMPARMSQSCILWYSSKMRLEALKCCRLDQIDLPLSSPVCLRCSLDAACFSQI